jgi:hypothetical protein
MPWTPDNPHIEGVAWWREGTRIGIAFDYDPDAVQRIKEVPARHRKYDPGLRCWFIANEALALDLLAELPQFVFGGDLYYEGRPDWLAVRAEWIETRGFEQKKQRKDQTREERRGRRDRRARGDPAPPPSGPYDVLNLTTAAPPELVAAAYRALAKLHHPDAGGDEATMKAINAAYEELTK